MKKLIFIGLMLIQNLGLSQISYVPEKPDGMSEEKYHIQLYGTNKNLADFKKLETTDPKYKKRKEVIF